jgi:hypothetical protein
VWHQCYPSAAIYGAQKRSTVWHMAGRFYEGGPLRSVGSRGFISSDSGELHNLRWFGIWLISGYPLVNWHCQAHSREHRADTFAQLHRRISPCKIFSSSGVLLPFASGDWRLLAIVVLWYGAYAYLDPMVCFFPTVLTDWRALQSCSTFLGGAARPILPPSHKFWVGFLYFRLRQ